MISTSFKLPDLKSDPFDYEKSDVRVSLKTPDTTLEIPAFYDGDSTWRMRYTPIRQGTYSIVSIKLNSQIAHETALETKEWTVSGEQDAGFVRIDPGDKRRFVFDNGNTYFPLGHNQAWESKESGAIPTLFEKMGKAGENWSRVWMNHWDNKNLDWSAGSKKIGEIDLGVAKRWDGIVEAAGKSGIYFQLTLQHHGQYSSTSGQKFSNNTNANWQDNPYNSAKGGFP